MKIKKILAVGIISILIFSLIGCGNDKKPQTENDKVNVESDTKDKEDEPIEKKKIVLYFSDDQAMYLKKEEAEVDELTPENVLKKLIEGPSKSEHYATLPKETKILSVKVEDDIAYVDIDGSIKELLGGGSASEIMAVNSIADTLVLNKELNISKVQLLIDGKSNNTFAGHVDITQPVEPDMKMIK